MTRSTTDDLVLLNLGCGLHAPAGWVNVDRSPNLLLDQVRPLKRALRRAGILKQAHMVEWPRNIRRYNITKRLPWDDASVDGIYSSHTLEHLYFNDAKKVLQECLRVLRPDGVLRLALPDTHAAAQTLLAGESGEFASAGEKFDRYLNAFPVQAPTTKQKMLAPLSSPPHRWQPTPDLVETLLHDAGFRVVQQQAFLSGDLPRLADVEHRAKSMFVEAKR